MVGDFDMPDRGCWSEVETLRLRETAAKREEGIQGSKTRQMMLLLEFSEQFSLTQRVSEHTRKDHTLDLCWTNSSCSRDCYTIQNVSLSDHNYVALNYSIKMLNEDSKEEKNHFSTEIQKYNLEKLDAAGWNRLNRSLANQDWEGIVDMTPSQIQDKIITNLELAVKEIAELKKKLETKPKYHIWSGNFWGSKRKQVGN